MMWGGGYDGGWSVVAMVFMGLFWLALVALVVWAVFRLTSRPQGQPPMGIESARSILDRRLAAGEIDAAQYAELRRVLEGRSADRSAT